LSSPIPLAGNRKPRRISASSRGIETGSRAKTGGRSTICSRVSRWMASGRVFGGSGVLLLFSIGLPGRFAEWCDNTIARLASSSSGLETVVRTCPSAADLVRYQPFSPPLEDAALALIAGDASHTVMAVRQPDSHLRAALADTNARFLVSLDSPRDAAADLLADTAAEPRLVTRAVANSCASAIRFPQLPGAVLLQPESVRDNAADCVLALVRHFGFTPNDTAIAAAVAAFPASRATNCDGEDYWPEAIPEAARPAMRGAFAGYEDCFAGRGLGQIVWDRDLFIANDPQKRATDVLDLSGGARILIFGPYIHLPPSPWTAQVRIAVSPEAAGHVLMIEAYSGRQLAAATLQPPGGGIFTTDLSFSLGEPSPDGLEIRVTVTEDNAKGQLAFGQVALTPMGVREPEVASDWNQEAKTMLGL
jgi:hypothetical protein